MKLTDPNDLIAAAVAAFAVPPGCAAIVIARHPNGMRAWWQDYDRVLIVQDLRHLADHIEQGGAIPLAGSAAPN